MSSDRIAPVGDKVKALNIDALSQTMTSAQRKQTTVMSIQCAQIRWAHMDAPATEATLEMAFELAKVGLLEFLGINT